MTHPCRVSLDDATASTPPAPDMATITPSGTHDDAIDDEMEDTGDFDDLLGEDFDDLLGEDDDWEDTQAYQQIVAQMPAGWYMIKITNFNAQKLRDIKEWCEMNMTGEHRRIGWHSGCAYSAAMQFANAKDAVLFKLMWS